MKNELISAAPIPDEEDDVEEDGGGGKKPELLGGEDEAEEVVVASIGFVEVGFRCKFIFIFSPFGRDKSGVDF